jgi:hypothetical protein
MILGLITLGSSIAHAEGHATGIFVEPGVTYEFSNSSINLPSPLNNDSGNVHGFGLMGRLGVRFADIIFVAADGRWGRPTFHDTTNNYESAATEYNYGVTAGIQTPIAGVRLWGSWIIGGGLDPDAANNLDVKYTGASGWRVGAGLYIDVVSVNFEYQHLNYSTVDVQNSQFGPFNSSTNFGGSQLSNNSYIFSLSFPVTL